MVSKYALIIGIMFISFIKSKRNFFLLLLLSCTFIRSSLTDSLGSGGLRASLEKTRLGQLLKNKTLTINTTTENSIPRNANQSSTESTGSDQSSIQPEPTRSSHENSIESSTNSNAEAAVRGAKKKGGSTDKSASSTGSSVENSNESYTRSSSENPFQSSNNNSDNNAAVREAQKGSTGSTGSTESTELTRETSANSGSSASSTKSDVSSTEKMTSSESTPPTSSTNKDKTTKNTVDSKAKNGGASTQNAKVRQMTRVSTNGTAPIDTTTEPYDDDNDNDTSTLPPSSPPPTPPTPGPTTPKPPGNGSFPYLIGIVVIVMLLNVIGCSYMCMRSPGREVVDTPPTDQQQGPQDGMAPAPMMPPRKPEDKAKEAGQMEAQAEATQKPDIPPPPPSGGEGGGVTEPTAGEPKEAGSPPEKSDDSVSSGSAEGKAMLERYSGSQGSASSDKFEVTGTKLQTESKPGSLTDLAKKSKSEPLKSGIDSKASESNLGEQSTISQIASVMSSMSNVSQVRSSKSSATLSDKSATIRSSNEPSSVEKSGSGQSNVDQSTMTPSTTEPKTDDESLEITKFSKSAGSREASLTSKSGSKIREPKTGKSASSLKKLSSLASEEGKEKGEKKKAKGKKKKPKSKRK